MNKQFITNIPVTVLKDKIRTKPHRMKVYRAEYEERANRVHATEHPNWDFPRYPPIIKWWSEGFVVQDGNHRIALAIENGEHSIPCLIVDKAVLIEDEDGVYCQRDGAKWSCRGKVSEVKNVNEMEALNSVRLCVEASKNKQAEGEWNESIFNQYVNTLNAEKEAMQTVIDICTETAKTSATFDGLVYYLNAYVAQIENCIKSWNKEEDYQDLLDFQM